METKKTGIFRDQTGKYSFNKFISTIVLFTLFIPITYVVVNELFARQLDLNNAIILASVYLILALMVVAPAAVKAFVEKSQILDKLTESKK